MLAPQFSPGDRPCRFHSQARWRLSDAFHWDGANSRFFAGLFYSPGCGPGGIDTYGIAQRRVGWLKAEISFRTFADGLSCRAPPNPELAQGGVALCSAKNENRCGLRQRPHIRSRLYREAGIRD